MHFDLTDLQLFCAIADSPSLTQAAKHTFISPAAASTRIKKLETQLDTRLFYRHNKGMELTDDGLKLLKQARSILRQVEQVKHSFSQYRSDATGHVRLYANTTAVTDFLPEILADFLIQRPAVTIDLQERLTKDIIRGVLNGTTDIGILSGSVSTQSLEVIHFSTDRLAVVTPINHPLTQKQRLKFTETLSHPYIGFHNGSTLGNFLSDLQASMGVTMDTRVNVSGFESVCRMVEAGVGISIVPESSANRHQQTMNIHQIYLDEVWAERERSIIVQDYQKLEPVAQALVQEILASYEVAYF
ncbi:LysR family transcriptional regulator [Psychrobacter sp. I-STPA6b]|uniref:LysR family transcriptional regulator n=1 Tax=Psychrobacter sp. I-STPA6b TaxID=2585718 RepID=UPI001D0C7DE2|nr:LysR family transcriptional regulator [Psychrobacter sp. I-STPA6b]